MVFARCWITASRAKASITSETWRCQPCQLRVSLWSSPSDLPRVGDRVELVVGYSDTTVHLHERILGMRRGTVEAAWLVSARGKLA